MSVDEATPQERKLAALLAAFDDALASDMPLPATQASPEIQARLDEDLECVRLLDQLRQTGAGAAPADGLPPTDPDARYTVLRLQGEGGIGQVWLGATYLTVVSWSDTQVIATVALTSGSGAANQSGVWSKLRDNPSRSFSHAASKSCTPDRATCFT